MSEQEFVFKINARKYKALQFSLNKSGKTFESEMEKLSKRRAHCQAL